MKKVSAARSRIMRAVKSANTAPELTVRRIITGLGWRYRLNRRDLPGTPDLAFISIKKTIFVNGCFWHKHHCRRGARIPKTNKIYWTAKIDRNVKRDRSNLSRLRRNGWGYFVVWECELKNIRKVESKLASFLGSASRRCAHR